MKPFLTLVIIIFSFFINFNLYAQDKDPIAITDYFNAVADVQNILRPLPNDIADPGHTIKIINVIGNVNSTISFNDSIIFYTPTMQMKGPDSIRYRIRDIQNNLASDIVFIYINVKNEAFDTLNMNNISALISSYGLFFWDVTENPSHYEFPKGSGLNTIFYLTLNLKGEDSYQNQYFSGKLNPYNGLDGSDFFPGPVSSTEAYTPDYDSAWRKVWKLNKSEINNHTSNWNQVGYEMPENIRIWPGNGNLSQGQAANLAPYQDFNDNGIYDPVNGDYPIIRGDQSIYFIYNDISYPHTEYGGDGLSAEIHCMVYGFSAPNDTALNNTVFINFMIFNRSLITYTPFQISLIADFDLGYSNDDYLGCDTLLNSAIAYNGTSFDYGEGSGYGEHPPAQSITILNRALYGFSLSCFLYDLYPYLNYPASIESMNNKMNNFWIDGEPIINNGCGHPSCAGGDTTRFAFPGDPRDNSAWSMPQAQFPPTEINAFINVSPVAEWKPGDAVCIDLALTTARDENGDHLDSYALLKQYIPQIKSFYDLHFPESCFDVAPYVENFQGNSSANIHLYPNPADKLITVELTDLKITSDYSILDLTGRLRKSGKIQNNPEIINVSSLSPGMYIFRIQNSEAISSIKFIKD